MKPETPVAEVAIHWIEAETHREVPIKGAIGGAHPDGTVTIRFYSEKASLPSLTRHPVDEGGGIDWAIPTEQRESDLTRIFYLTGTVSPTVARQIAVWIIEKAQEAENWTQPSKEEVPNE